MSQENFQVEDLSSIHKWRTELPNILFDLPISANAFKLYAYFKKVAGDKGACWQSNKLISENTMLSLTAVKEAKKELQMPQMLLGGLPLIKNTVRKSENKSFQTSLVQIVDIWGINFKIFYDPEPKKKITEPESDQGGVGQNTAEGRPEYGHKEEPFKKNQYSSSEPLAVPPKNEEQAANAAEEDSSEKGWYPELDQITDPSVTDSVKMKITAKFSQEQVKYAVSCALGPKVQSQRKTLYFVLKNPDEWQKPKSDAQLRDDLHKILDKIRHLDGKKAGNVVLRVGKDHFEESFACWNNYVDVNHPDFQNQIEKIYEKYS